MEVSGLVMRAAAIVASVAVIVAGGGSHYSGQS